MSHQNNEVIDQVREHLEKRVDAIKKDIANSTAMENLVSAAKISAYTDVMRFIRTISKNK